MCSRRVEVKLLPLVALILIPVLFLTLSGVEAGRSRLASPPELARVAAALESPSEATASEEATAVGYVYYNGAPVAGADVTILRDNITVYVTTTATSGGGLPSFTVNLSDPPIFAAPDELLVLEVEYNTQINRTSFRVMAGEQILYGRLSSSCGPTEISGGMIAVDETWTAECGPYIVSGNVLVNDGATLTIEAGATILLDATKAMLVDGRLLTEGTNNELVSFTKGQEPNWAYISFSSGSTGSNLNGTLLESAGSEDTVANNAALRVDGADVTLSGVIVQGSADVGIRVFNSGSAPMDDLIVTDNHGWGIYVDTDALGLSIQNSHVYSNTGGGIYVAGLTEGIISGNTVSLNNDSGIKIYWAGGPIIISGNRIVANRATNGGGLKYEVTEGTIVNNFIARNVATDSGGGAYLYPYDDVEIRRNFILYNEAYDTSKAGGGMYLKSRVAEIQLTNNIFAGNLAAAAPATNPGPGGGLYIDNPTGGNNSLTVHQNAFLYNFAQDTPGGAIFSDEPQLTLQENTIVDNVATSPFLGEGYGGLHLISPAVINSNNLFHNYLYDLFNASPLADGTVNAQSNWWGTTDTTEIDELIYDWFDDAAYGVVDYANYLSEPWSAAPVSPPADVETSVDGSSLTVSWAANPESDLAGYKVYRDTSDVIFDPAIKGEIAAIDVGLVTNFTLTCLPPDTYYLVVTAYDDDADGQDDWTDGNESWFSQEVHDTTTATPACNPPAAPSSLNATAFSASQINLDWTDNADDETAYRVERSLDGSTGWSEIASLPPNATAYSDTGLNCGTTYHYRTRAYRVGDDQYSAYGNVDQATTMSCQPPGAPSGLSATAASASQINLGWTDNATDETAYRVERSPDGSTGWTEIDSLPANSTTYNDTSLTCDTLYYYRVRAYRSGDGQYSAYSNVAHDTTDSCPPPAAPTGLSATAVSASQINLSWTDNATDETAYRVERSPDGSTGWTEIDSLPANSASYIDSGLACDTTYYYRVRTYRGNDSQYSTYSDIAHDTTDGCSAPAAPSNLSAVAWSASQINLTWTDNADDETAYLVERSPNGSGNWTEIASLGANSTSYSDTELACGESYYYRVRAYRAGDGQYSAYSNVDGATTDACPPPDAPTDLLATPVSASQINLTWTDNAHDETVYLVERSPDGSSDWSQISGLPADSTTYSDSGLACGTTHYYRVRVYRADDDQYSAYSEMAQATTNLCSLKPASYLPMLIGP